MKILIILFFFLIDLFSTELSWVDKQIDAIKPARVGIRDSKLISLKDPIIFLNKRIVKKSKKVKKRVIVKKYRGKKVKIKVVKNNFRDKFTLEAIINNSALINKSWVSIGDSIKGYKIVSINNNSVILSKYGKSIILSTSTKNRTIKFKNR